jgi:hypothetical protein
VNESEDPYRSRKRAGQEKRQTGEEILARLRGSSDPFDLVILGSLYGGDTRRLVAASTSLSPAPASLGSPPLRFLYRTFAGS